MSGPYAPGWYDAQLPDLLDAEMWAAVRRMADLMRRAYRLATFFPPREVTR